MILLLGPTGAGKSVQAQSLAKRHKQFVWFALGAILRGSSDPDITLEITKGELVSDEIASKLLSRKLDDLLPDQVPIVDGFPRRPSQIKDLEKLLRQTKRRIIAVINLQISRSTAEKRLHKRQRSDDTPAAIAQKWEWFQADTVPVIEHYRQLGLVVDINGEQPANEVTAAIEKALQL